MQVRVYSVSLDTNLSHVQDMNLFHTSASTNQHGKYLPVMTTLVDCPCVRACCYCPKKNKVSDTRLHSHLDNSCIYVVHPHLTMLLL